MRKIKFTLFIALFSFSLISTAKVKNAPTYHVQGNTVLGLMSEFPELMQYPMAKNLSQFKKYTVRDIYITLINKGQKDRCHFVVSYRGSLGKRRAKKTGGVMVTTSCRMDVNLRAFESNRINNNVTILEN